MEYSLYVSLCSTKFSLFVQVTHSSVSLLLLVPLSLIFLSLLSLCMQVNRVQWPCFLFSCWITTWPPGSSASGTASSPWASPSAGHPWEACCSLSSGCLHQQHHSHHLFGYHWHHHSCFCVAAVSCDSGGFSVASFCRVLKLIWNQGKMPLKIEDESQRLHSVKINFTESTFFYELSSIHLGCK